MQNDTQNTTNTNTPMQHGDQCDVLPAKGQNDQLAMVDAGKEESIAETLNEIQPTAGAESSQNSDVSSQDAQNSELVLNDTNFRAQIQAQSEIGALDAFGALDETELDYAQGVSVTPNAFQFIAPADAAISQAAALDVPNVVDVPEITLEPVLPKIDITLSNATTNEIYINDTDHYKLDAVSIGTKHKLFGDEMDIAGVADDVRVNYTFKTEDSFHARLKSPWNALKNIEVESDDLNTVILKNFVHADVTLGGDADKIVKITDAKRGFIETEDGNDVIIVKALTNGAGWSNIFDIDSGAGNDKIIVRGDKGHTIADIDAGEGNDRVIMCGDYERSDVDLGAGNDRFNGGHSEDAVRGGAGDDRIVGRAGHDVLYGGDILLPEASSNATRLEFEFVKSQAGYKNTVGFYEIAEDGSIQNVQIVFENMKAQSPGDTRSFDIEGDGSNVETFIIANGFNKNGQYGDLDMDGGFLQFVCHYGQANQGPAKISDDPNFISLVYNDGAQEIVLNGNVFHDIHSLNRDGQDHTIESAQGDKTEIGYEDLYNLGDRDYQDAVFTLEDTPLYDFTYELNGSDNDIIKGGDGNDVMIGGAGNDRLIGGNDTDIAVFMGSADEYVITQSGGKTIIEDTVAGRDGTDVLKSVEGLLFGMEDLYADMLADGQTDLDMADLLDGYNPLQTAIDDFVHHADQNQTQSVAVQNDIPTLEIFTVDDALINQQAAII
jgi:serralysin